MWAIQDAKKPKLEEEMTTSDVEESLPEPMDIEEPEVIGLLRDTADYFGVTQENARVLVICMEVS